MFTGLYHTLSYNVAHHLVSRPSTYCMMMSLHNHFTFTLLSSTLSNLTSKSYHSTIMQQAAEQLQHCIVEVLLHHQQSEQGRGAILGVMDEARSGYKGLLNSAGFGF